LVKTLGQHELCEDKLYGQSHVAARAYIQFVEMQACKRAIVIVVQADGSSLVRAVVIVSIYGRALEM
jgi:hypothetical protein